MTYGYAASPRLFRRVPGGLATAAAVLLSLQGALGCTGLIRLAEQLRALQGVSPDAQVGSMAQPDWLRTLGLLTLPISLATVVVFLLWFHRAYAHVIGEGCGSRRGAGWSTALWLLPIVNLFSAYRPVVEIWDTGTPPGDPPRRHLLRLWWTAGSVAVALQVLVYIVTIGTAARAVGDAVAAQREGREAPRFTLHVGAVRSSAYLSLGTTLCTTVAALAAAAFVIVSNDRLRERVGMAPPVHRLRAVRRASGPMLLAATAAAATLLTASAVLTGLLADDDGGVMIVPAGVASVPAPGSYGRSTALPTTFRLRRSDSAVDALASG